MSDKKTNNVFERIEKKYLISQDKFDALFNRIESYVNMDEHGLNTICNIYYDTASYGLIRNSIEKPKYKEKLRLRSYGTPYENSRVFIEIKKKYKDTVFKRRVALKLNEAENYLERGIKPVTENQILNEIDYFINFYRIEKKLFLAYDRVAFFAKEDSGLRITFDHNIRSRAYDLDLQKGDYGRELLTQDMYLMEIKTASAFPMWLVRELSDLNIYPSSFSKYGNVYKEYLGEGLTENYSRRAFENSPDGYIQKSKYRREQCLQAF